MAPVDNVAELPVLPVHTSNCPPVPDEEDVLTELSATPDTPLITILPPLPVLVDVVFKATFESNTEPPAVKSMPPGVVEDEELLASA